MAVEVRAARLDDTAAISGLFRARIGVWQRLDADHRVETVPYEALTVYEKWLHGGAWMSLETGAVHLNNLLLGAGVPLVAAANGAVIGYAEAYPGSEPDPFGAHVHLTQLIVHDDWQTKRVGDALLEAVFARAKALKARVMVARTGHDLTAGVVERELTSTPVTALRRFTVSARQGQIFYKVVDHPDTDPRRIAGWSMPVGRSTSARCEWELLMARTFETISEISARQRHRVHVSSAGLEAIALVRQQMYDPRAADVSLWAPRGINMQLVTGLRDWAHRQGYRTLSMLAQEAVIPALGTDAEDDGYRQETCAIAWAD